MSDRRIEAGLNLNTRLKSETGSDMQSGDRPRPQAEEQARARFEQAMKDEAAPNAVPSPSTPFELFGAKKPEGPSASISQDMQGLLKRLMVSRDGSAAHVRMELDDGHLPGVTVAVYEDGGLLTVDFICREEESRKQLNAASPDLVREMAQSLNRPVVWRVMTDDEDDLCLFEVQGAP